MAGVVPFSLGAAADLVDKSIQTLFIKGSEGESQLFKQYYNVVTGVTDYYEKDSSLTGLGYAGRITENAVIIAQSPLQGYDKTYTQVQFGTLLSVTWAMWYFGIKKRNLEALVQEARNACADLRELRCADRLDNAWSTSYTANDESGNYSISTVGGDGVAFISTAHTREDGGTNINNQITDGTTVNMDFEYDALKAAHRTASLVKNPKGKPMNINLDTLVCSRGSTNQYRAVEMLGAFRKGWQPATADREGAGVPDYNIVALPWITTNTDYWFMFDSRMKNPRYGLQYKESNPISLEGPHVVFKTNEIQYKAQMSFDLGHNDSRGWTGSKNTNAS